MSWRRRSVTPLDSELTPTAGVEDQQRLGPVERLREWGTSRAERKPPTTLGGAIVRGLVRLTILVAAASGIAYAISAGVGRGPAFAFYIVGALLFGAGAFTAGAGIGNVWWRTSGYYYNWGGRSISMSGAWVLVGAIVVGIGVAIEAPTR